MNRHVKDLAIKWRDLGFPIPPELPSRRQATRRARRLISRPSPSYFHVQSNADKDCLHAAVSIASDSLPGDETRARVSALLNAADWPDDRFGELADLKRESERSIARLDKAVEMGDAERATVTEGDFTIESRHVDTANKIGRLVKRLTRLIETSPRDVFRISKNAIDVIQQSCGTHPKLVGELALLAGISARFLHRYKEALELFDVASKRFGESDSSPGDLARLRYQRLAFKLEARQLDGVLAESLVLQSAFEHLGMAEWATKCLYLQGAAYRELGRYADCVRVMEDVHERAVRIESFKMQAMSLTGLAGCYAALGDASLAVGAAKKAQAALRRFRSPVTIAKLHWSLGDLLKSVGRFEESEIVHRIALRELARLRLPAEVAAVRVVLTDTLLQLGRDDDARAELHAALPDLERYEMFHESVAAVALLRASLRRNKIDRSALNRLPGLRPRPN